MTYGSATAAAATTGMRHAKGWLLAYGIVSICLGVLAFLAPVTATLAVTVVTGSFLLVAGIASVGVALFGGEHEGRLYAGLFGALTLVVGGLIAFQPASGAVSLTLLIAVWLFGRGAIEIGLGFRLRHDRILMIVLGVTNVALAIIVVATLPASALALPGFILGLSFLAGGINALVMASRLHKGEAIDLAV